MLLLEISEAEKQRLSRNDSILKNSFSSEIWSGPMKKIFKAIGLILAFILIYIVAQNVAAAIFMGVKLFKAGIEAGMSGAMPNMADLTKEVTDYVYTLTPWLLLFAVLVSLPFYYLFFRKRKQELATFVSVRSIHPLCIPVLVVLGLSFNVIIEFFMALLQQIDLLKPLFESYQQHSGIIMNGGFWLSLIVIGVIGPIFEEILFRGLVFGEMRKISKVWVALLIQALLFGVIHFNVVQGIYAFLAGLLLGYIYYRSNSIVAPMIMHISINASSVIITQFLTGDDLGNWGGAIVIASFLMFMIAGAFILTHRGFKHTMDNSLYEQNRTPGPQGPGRSDA
jgi:membrane protease YdiL (CAAX protease family)